MIAAKPSSPFTIKSVLRGLPGFRLLRLVRGLIRGAEARDVELLRWRHPADLFQPEGCTRPDRYPEIFAMIRARIGDGPDHRILSFGCSTGEEVFSLRRHFPQAWIKGIDINPRSIARCRAGIPRGDRNKTVFAVAGTAAEEPLENYDAVFAMAVFRHGDLSSGPPSCAKLLRFDRFEQAVTTLAARVKLGGFLVIRHANFRFGDTEIARRFEPLLAAQVTANSPHYDRRNRRLPDTAWEDAVFQRLA